MTFYDWIFMSLLIVNSLPVYAQLGNEAAFSKSVLQSWHV